MLENIGGAFVFDGASLFMDLSMPTVTAIVYFACCAVHNLRRQEGLQRSGSQRLSSSWIDGLAVMHNAVLVVFSALVCVIATYHVVLKLRSVGVHAFLCPDTSAPVATDGWGSPRLSGTLHFWCYVFYLSKYYELVDTLLLMLRSKHIIPLHAVHHALIPLIMCMLFHGGVSVSLVALTVVNSLVHVVMYTYYLLMALRMDPTLWWKRQITRLQILQFSCGVLGGSYYWFMYFRELRLVPGAWPPITYSEGCAGGDPLMVCVGYIMNLVLLCLFVSFYWGTYRRSQKKVT